VACYGVNFTFTHYPHAFYVSKDVKICGYFLKLEGMCELKIMGNIAVEGHKNPNETELGLS
jgi:hypothetical protein